MDLIRGVLLAIWAGAGVAAAVVLAAAEPAAADRGALPAFRSDAELRIFLRERLAQARGGQQVYDLASPSVAAPAPMAVETAAEAPGVTNTQEAGVDEGGIVKQRGDLLVILRRGRLHTVSLAGGAMRPVDRIDAFPPGPGRGAGGQESAWYDELLLLGDRAVVIGYSYARGGTEVNRFRIDGTGRLRFEDAHQLRSNDYYSAENYASRLIGSKLVFYTPLGLHGSGDILPAMRRWRGNADARFRPIAGARRVHIPPTLRDGRGAAIDTLHTVAVCDLAAAELDCQARGVLGAPSRSFYVSPEAVYLWITDAWSPERRRPGARGFLYRMPLDGSEPSAVAVRGGPVDQFSFRAEERAGRLHVLVRSEGGDDAMWRPGLSQGEPALVEVRARDFGDGSREVPLDRYRALPLHDPGAWDFKNRFVGAALIYGTAEHGRGTRANPLYVAPLDGRPVATLPVGQGVSRIEALGRDAVVVGGTAAGALGFATVELDRGARLGDRFALPQAGEGESRSHAFFFRPDPNARDGGSGVLGLPVLRHGAGAGGASMLYLRRDARRLADAGEVAATPVRNQDDGCVASCVDWYGNARPIFIGDRVFALMGYELVEGRLESGRVREVARADFTPARAR